VKGGWFLLQGGGDRKADWVLKHKWLGKKTRTKSYKSGEWIPVSSQGNAENIVGEAPRGHHRKNWEPQFFFKYDRKEHVKNWG